MFSGRRQPSRGGTSRMMREYHVRIYQRFGVKFPRAYSARAALSRLRRQHVPCTPDGCRLAPTPESAGSGQGQKRSEAVVCYLAFVVEARLLKVIAESFCPLLL